MLLPLSNEYKKKHIQMEDIIWKKLQTHIIKNIT